MTDRQNDDFLSHYLAGGTRVSLGYDALAKPEPPGHLDEAVRTLAKKAADRSGADKIRHWRWNRWLVSSALAATLTLTVAVTVRIVTTPSAELVRQAAQPVVDAQTAGALLDAAGEGDAQELAADGSEQYRGVRPAPDAPQPDLGGTSVSSSLSRIVPSYEAPARTAGELSPKSSDEPIDRAIAAAAVDRFATGVATDHRVDALASTSGSSEGAGPEAGALASMSAQTGQGLRERHTKESLRLSALMAVPREQLRSIAAEDWLERITALYHAGKKAQADEELALFRETHPDHPLGDLAPHM